MADSRFSLRAVLATALAGGLAIACADRAPEITDVNLSHAGSNPYEWHIFLCKTGSDASFDLTNGDVSSVSLTDGECAQVATHPGDQSTKTVTITETSMPSNVVLDQVVVEDYRVDGVLVTSTTSDPTVSVDMIDDHYYFVTYENADLNATNGRMTGGGGQVRIDGVRITRGLTIHCDITLSNNVEINWTGGNKWHLDKPLTSATCIDDPAYDPVPPAAPFDTFIGEGIGKLNGVDGSFLRFTFVDDGEPGTTDRASIDIWAPGDDPSTDPPVLSVSGILDNGNFQAHWDQPHGQKP